MSYARKSVVVRAHLLAPAVLLIGLAACSGKDETAAPATDAKPAAAAPAATAPAAEPAVSSKVQAMGSEELREAASQALRDNRMYAPAGDNAIEYYLALRDKTPDDASVKSALTDLLPYTRSTLEELRQVMDDVTARTGLARFCVLGLSSGALVAMASAGLARRPDRA